jgi:hypothetical protein
MGRPIRLFGAAAAIVCGLNPPAHAQAASRRHTVPPVEVGVGIDAAQMRAGLYLDGGLVLEPMVNVRLTKPSTTNRAFEVTFALGGTSSSDYDTKGLYTLQLKHLLWQHSRSDIHLFATYGAAGVWRQDRIYGRGGETRIRHAVIPFYAVAGAGLQWKVAARAAVRTELQAVGLAWAPVGLRISTGVSIPFGRY